MSLNIKADNPECVPKHYILHMSKVTVKGPNC